MAGRKWRVRWHAASRHQEHRSSRRSLSPDSDQPRSTDNERNACTQHNHQSNFQMFESGAGVATVDTVWAQALRRMHPGGGRVASRSGSDADVARKTYDETREAMTDIDRY